MECAGDRGYARWIIAAVAASALAAAGVLLFVTRNDGSTAPTGATSPPFDEPRAAQAVEPESSRDVAKGRAAVRQVSEAVTPGPDVTDATGPEPSSAAPAIAEEAPPVPGTREDPGEARSGPATAGGAPGLPAAALPAAPEPPEKPPAAGEEQKEKWSPPRFTVRRAEREAMARVIRAYGLTDPAVLNAMRAVPRHEFVPAKHSRRAYADTPLPIGEGQTISQPYIVAEMTRQLRLTHGSRVLEIGTGSGYQAAVLTEFTPHVYTMEIVGPLAGSAKERLSRLGYDVAKVRHADGYHGWPEEAPFDAIIVTCAAGQIPPPLIEQLRPGGRMVIPVGGRFAVQWLMLIEKDEDCTVRSRSLMGVRFVPFVRRRESTE